MMMKGPELHSPFWPIRKQAVPRNPVVLTYNPCLGPESWRLSAGITLDAQWLTSSSSPKMNLDCTLHNHQRARKMLLINHLTTLHWFPRRASCLNLFSLLNDSRALNCDLSSLWLLNPVFKMVSQLFSEISGTSPRTITLFYHYVLKETSTSSLKDSQTDKSRL